MVGKAFNPRLLALALAACWAGAAGAASWDIQPGVSARATASDNSTQGGSGGSTIYATTISPTLDLNTRGEGPLTAAASYRLNSVNRFGGSVSDKSDLTHVFSGNGHLDVINDLLFLDAQAHYTQLLASLLEAPTDQSVNNTNRVNASSYTLAPSLVKRLGAHTTGKLGYTLGEVKQSGPAGNHGRFQVYEASLDGDPGGGRLGWGLSYQMRDATNTRYSDMVLERYGVSASYLLDRTFRVLATYGDERNQYDSVLRTGGAYYSLGFAWAPSQRSSLEMTVGKRYFGNTYSLKASHKTRATTWHASYAEDISDFSRQQVEYSDQLYWISPSTGGLSNSPTPPDDASDWIRITAQDLALIGGLDTATLTALGVYDYIGPGRGIYVSKILHAGVDWKLGKLGLGVFLADLKRLYQLTAGAEDRKSSFGVSASYQLGAKTTLDARLTQNRVLLPALLYGLAADRQDDYTLLDLGATRRFSEKLTGSLYLRRHERDSDAANADYVENSISASINYQF